MEPAAVENLTDVTTLTNPAVKPKVQIKLTGVGQINERTAKSMFD